MHNASNSDIKSMEVFLVEFYKSCYKDIEQ